MGGSTGTSIERKCHRTFNTIQSRTITDGHLEQMVHQNNTHSLTINDTVLISVHFTFNTHSNRQIRTSLVDPIHTDLCLNTAHFSISPPGEMFFVRSSEVLTKQYNGHIIITLTTDLMKCMRKDQTEASKAYCCDKREYNTWDHKFWSFDGIPGQTCTSALKGN